MKTPASACSWILGAAQLGYLCLGGAQRGFCAGLLVSASCSGHGGDDIGSQAIGCRHIHGEELNAAFHQLENEGDVSRQPIQLCNDQPGASPLRRRDSLLQFRAAFLAGTDLGEFSD